MSNAMGSNSLELDAGAPIARAFPARSQAAEDGTELLLDAVGPVAGSRLLLVGDTAPDLASAAIRRGCARVLALRAADGIDPASAEIAFVAPGALEGRHCSLFARIMRGLVPMGSLAVQLDARAGFGAAAAASVVYSLRAHGFSGVRTMALPDGRVLVLAERPSSNLPS